jgi:aspartyl-tRNA(Asn)/glutamyl-tRNA(Gln) amidotransferase subunit A
MDDGPLTITAAAALIRSGLLTPVELLDVCLRRIDRYEPRVQAWAYLDRDRARRDAESLTAELKAGTNRGPLHGIPIGVKDIIDVFDMPTGCGSNFWANSYARRDATVVQRLREAGAVILGKTVTTPFAFLDPPPTRNPWNLNRTPGGSSSGSAAAVACGMCLGALGTQTGGSITRPASFCGVCSLKPTFGRVSGVGVLPLAPSLDHVGVMANSVRDLAILFQTIAGPDERNGWCQANRDPIPDCVPLLDANAWQPREYLRLGGMFEELLSPAARPLYDAAMAKIADEGSEPARVVPPAGFAELPAAHRLLMAVEAAMYHADRLTRRPDDYPPQIRRLVEEGVAGRGNDYVAAMTLRDTLQKDLAGMLSRDRRFFLTPATTDLPPDPTTTGNPAFNTPWSFTGLPTVSIPAAWSADGLPFAVQFVGKPSAEHELLVAAAACEQFFRFPRRLPE